jgi:hypothetical protein
MKFVLITFLFVASMLSSRAERDIVSIFQPLSLLGTELEAYPLGKNESVYADVLATSTIVSSAYPEAIVQAIALPHHFYNAPEGFPAESNLIILSGGHLDAAWGEARHSITIDFSKASVKDLGVTLKQLCRLTLLCLSRSLQQKSSDGKPFTLNWKLPSGHQGLLTDLPATLTLKSAEQGAAANP